MLLLISSLWLSFVLTQALARLKPFVRRNVAEILAVIGRTELRMLLGKLLLYRGMDSTASDAVSGNTSVATSMGSAVVSPTPAATLAAAGVEIQNSSSSDATVLRRSTLRFLTLVLDGVDESVDKFAGELLEVAIRYFSLFKTMILCPDVQNCEGVLCCLPDDFVL